MKHTKKALFLTLLVSSMALVGCGGGDQSSTPAGGSSSGAPQSTSAGGQSSAASQESSADPSLPKYEVTIDYEDGVTPQKQEYSHGDHLAKPQDPTAPAGKKFYGWKNVKNGGQIWNFDANDINVVMQDVELKPVFVDANQDAQVFEAELCPDITERIGKNGVPGMDGSTYSGGAQGRQLIYRAFDDYEQLGISGRYKILSYDEEDPNYHKADYCSAADLEDPDVFPFGGVIHFMYENGDTLTWEVESDAAVENVTLFMRLSGEYGIVNPETEELSSWVDEDTFPILVNGEKLKYGKVTLHNLVDKSYVTFQDYFVSASVSLKAGKNTIQMLVDNLETLNGTITSSAPCVDCIKLYSSSNITWPKAKIANLDMED